MTEQSNIQTANPLGTENVGKLLKKFAIPSIVAMLVNSLYNIVDQIFIGRGVGFLGNAATNVAFPFVVLSMAVSLMIANGCAANISLRLGEKRVEEASQGFGNALTLSILCGIAMAVLGLIFLTPLLKIFGASASVLPLAVEFTSISLIGIPFVMVGVVLNASIRTDGSPRYSMFSMLSGAIINTILNPIFIFVFHWGVQGSAIATVIGQVAGFTISMMYIKKFKHIKFSFLYLKLKLASVKTILTLGMSSFIMQISNVFVQIALNNSLNYYGSLSIYGSDIPLSALGIVMKVNMLLISIIMGTAVGAQPIIGYNYGAKKYTRVKSAYQYSAVISSIFAVAGFIMFMFVPQLIISLFGQANPLYNEFAVKCLRIFLMGICLAGFQITSSNYFQAIGKPGKSSLLSLSRQVLFLIPALLILPRFFGLDGILYAGPVADTLAFLTTTLFIIREMRYLSSKIKDTQPLQMIGELYIES